MWRMLPKLENGGRYTGYWRVSTDDQNPQLQIDALLDAGVPHDRIYGDVMTGSKMERNGLKRALRVTRNADTLVVWKLDRLGRSVQGVLEVISNLKESDIGFISIRDGFDTNTPTGQFMMTILLALAEMERNLVSERTKAGMAAARRRGRKFGPKHFVMDFPKRLAAFTKLWKQGLIPDGTMTPPEIIAALEAADPKAPKIKSVNSYYNWRRKGFNGFTPPPDVPLAETTE